MSDTQRAFRNIVVGVALVILGLYMAYVGHLKKVYRDWMINPRQGAPGEETAFYLWPKIEAYQNEHPYLWEIALYFPPYWWLDRDVWFTWPFVQRNWRFLVWFVLSIEGVGMVRSGGELLRLVDQLNHEDRLEKMRRRRHGGMTALTSGPPLIEIRNEILVRAAETGKWWGLNGMVVGGALSILLATLLQKWLTALLQWLGWG